MRRIGSLPTLESAERFAAHLRRQGHDCRIDADADGRTLWLYDEEALAQARSDLAAYREGTLTIAPEPPPPPATVRRAAPVLRNRFSVPRFLRRAPVTLGLMAAAIAATFAIDFGNHFLPYGDQLAIVPFEGVPDPWSERLWLHLRRGEIWRLVTPSLLHFSLWHLLLDLNWTYVFGGAIERCRGPLRLLGLVLFSAVCSNLGQYLWSGPPFGGLSGIGTAMFGYVWMKYRFQPETGLILPAGFFWFFWVYFLFCFTDLSPVPIANMAHAVGMASGILYGLIPLL